MSNSEGAHDRPSAEQRLDTLHRMAGALTHDFNNLLSVILTSSETLAAELDDDAHRGLALVGLHAAERGAELLRRLLTLAQDRPVGDDDIDCGEALESLRPLVRHAIPAGVGLSVTAPPEPVTCVADPTGLEAALLNLALNAGQATPLGGRVFIYARRTHLERREAARLGLVPGAYAAITVHDTGAGMCPATLARATEPLFTTRATGTGLGLSSVADFAAGAGGALGLQSKKGRGTTATLYLPLAHAVTDAAADAGTAASA